MKTATDPKMSSLATQRCVEELEQIDLAQHPEIEAWTPAYREHITQVVDRWMRADKQGAFR